MDKPRGQTGPFVYFSPKNGSFSDRSFPDNFLEPDTDYDKNITFSEFSLVHQSHDSDLTLDYL